MNVRTIVVEGHTYVLHVHADGAEILDGAGGVGLSSAAVRAIGEALLVVAMEREGEESITIRRPPR